MEKVSVALATYNGARYLHEQLSSLVGQTVRPAELVVSDDGSTDATLDIVRAFAAVAPFPVMIAPKSERLGFADNFLFAAETCRHDLIAFCDQDDIWLPRKIEAAVQRLRCDNSLIVLHTLLLTDELLRPTGHWVQDITNDRSYEPLELDPYATGWGNSMLFRRELATLIPRDRRPRQPEEPERPLSHDTWIYMLAAALGKVSHIAAPLILYRQHGNNSIGMRPVRRWRRLAQIGTVPIAMYRERALINERMGDLMDEVSRKPGPFAGPAQAATARFAERQALAWARAGVFEQPRLSSRLRSYHDWQRLAGASRPWIGSRIKDLALGVSGLYALSRSVRGPPSSKSGVA